MNVKCLFIYLLFFTCFVSGQNNLIVLAEDGEKFFLFVDDKQVNDSAQSQVEAATIYDDTCRIRAVFSKKTIPEFTAKVFLEQSKKPVSKRDFTYSISTEHGKRKLKFISMNETFSDTTIKVVSPQKKIEAIFISREKQKEEQDKLNENYPPPAPCLKTVSDSTLKAQIRSLKDEHIELNRIRNVKWFISHTCLSIDQMKTVLGIFDYEGSKVKLAKFYYDYLPEKSKFLELLPAFKYVTEKEDLKTFYRKKTEK